jgi:hypothetical protein
MAGRVQDSDLAWDEFIHNAASEAIHIVTERVARDGKTMMPVGSARYPRPGRTRRNPKAEAGRPEACAGQSPPATAPR